VRYDWSIEEFARWLQSAYVLSVVQTVHLEASKLQGFRKPSGKGGNHPQLAMAVAVPHSFGKNGPVPS
jgi:hypothetical protein